MFVCSEFNLTWILHKIYLCNSSIGAGNRNQDIKALQACFTTLVWAKSDHMPECKRHLGWYVLNIPKSLHEAFIPNSELPLLIENLEPLNSKITVYFSNITQSCKSVSSNWSNLRSNITTNFNHCVNRTT